MNEDALHDPDAPYDDERICELLEKARALGFSLDAGSEIKTLTLGQLDALVNRIQ